MLEHVCVYHGESCNKNADTNYTVHTAHESLTTKTNLNLWFFRSESKPKKNSNTTIERCNHRFVTMNNRWIAANIHKNTPNSSAKVKAIKCSPLHKQNTHTHNSRIDRYCVCLNCDGSEWGSTFSNGYFISNSINFNSHLPIIFLSFVDCCLAH